MRAAHAPGMPGTFSPPPRVSDSDMNHGKCVTHVPLCMSGSLTSGFHWSQWWEKRFRHSLRMHNPQFYASGKRPMPRQIIRSSKDRPFHPTSLKRLSMWHLWKERLIWNPWMRTRLGNLQMCKSQWLLHQVMQKAKLRMHSRRPSPWTLEIKGMEKMGSHKCMIMVGQRKKVTAVTFFPARPRLDQTTQIRAKHAKLPAMKSRDFLCIEWMRLYFSWVQMMGS